MRVTIWPRIYIRDLKKKKIVFNSATNIMAEEFQYEEPSFAVRNSYVFRCKEPYLWPGFISYEVPASVTHVIATK